MQDLAAISKPSSSPDLSPGPKKSHSIPNSPVKKKKEGKGSKGQLSPSKSKKWNEIEELRKTVKVLQAELEEVRTRNVYLNKLLDEQRM